MHHFDKQPSLIFPEGNESFDFGAAVVPDVPPMSVFSAVELPAHPLIEKRTSNGNVRPAVRKYLRICRLN
jgi:hypothetical protein